MTPDQQARLTDLARQYAEEVDVVARYAEAVWPRHTVEAERQERLKDGTKTERMHYEEKVLRLAGMLEEFAGKRDAIRDGR